MQWFSQNTPISYSIIELTTPKQVNHGLNFITPAYLTCSDCCLQSLTVKHFQLLFKNHCTGWWFSYLLGHGSMAKIMNEYIILHLIYVADFSKNEILFDLDFREDANKVFLTSYQAYSVFIENWVTSFLSLILKKYV